MHEGAIVQAIVDASLAALRTNGATGKVKEVRVLVGVCQGLVPDAMEMFFEMQSADTQLAGAKLAVELQSMVARCATCRHDFDLPEPIMFCPQCGRPMEMIKGKEVLLQAIEVEE
jgi:hydrogenase nickel incorporation protein HypA/HybF